MKKLILLSLLFASFISGAQSISEASLTGTWKVIDVKSVKEQAAADGFKNATFTFEANHNVIFTPVSKTQDIKAIAFMLAKAKWMLAGNAIKIGMEKDRFSVMEIDVQGANTFFIKETGITLSVQKI